MGRWSGLGLSSVAIMLALPASAGGQPLERHINGRDDACFERTYTAAHLAAHPDQTVSFIRFEHFPRVWGPIDAEGNVYFDREMWVVNYRVTLRLRRTGDQLYETSGTCRPEGDRLNCGVDCDGGSFTLHDDGTDTVLLKPSEGGFAIFSCGEGMELEPATIPADPDVAGMLTPGKDDKAFRMSRVSGEDCVAPPVPTL